jgi:GNAT superfamily N-acetyltransferase
MTAIGEPPFPFSDLALARRLERAEARSNAAIVESRAKLFPESGARWIEVAGAYAMFDGVSSPCTQTFGLGLFQKATSSDMQRIEEFFQERRAPVFHEVSPLADMDLLGLLNGRGYEPFEFTSVMFRSIGSPVAGSRSEKLQVRLVQDDEQELWGRTAARGWEASGDLADFMAVIGRIHAATPSAFAFLAEVEGRPIATGAMTICDGVALLAGASTIPEARGQGAQLALLDSRLRYAAEHGCDLAMMGALPGSASQRNAERHGFRIAYTRIKWRRSQRAP